MKNEQGQEYEELNKYIKENLRNKGMCVLEEKKFIDHLDKTIKKQPA